MIRRINLWGGPSLGKSTSAWFLAYQLKKRHQNVELCRERAKLLAYKGNVPTGMMQSTLFVEQMEEERTFLDNGVDLIVTDSPILLAVSYGMKYGQDEKFEQYFGNCYKAYDEEYPSLNIFLKRNPKLYQQHGRFESKEEATKMDALIYDHYRFWSANGIKDLAVIDSFAEDKLLDFILQELSL